MVGYGKRINKSAAKQTFYCKKCGHKFTPDDGFKGVRFSPEVIRTAVQFSKNGLTLRQIVERIGNQYRVRVGESTVHDWIKKYGGPAESHS